MKTLSTRIFVLLAVAFASAAFVACSDDDEKQKPGTLTPETTEFRFTGGSYSKTLAVATENLASFAADVVYAGTETGWVTPEVVAGGVKLTVQPNTSSKARSATLVLSARGVPSVEVAVSQKAAVRSDLTGRWVPAMNSQNAGDFFLDIAWTESDPELLPKVPLWENDDPVTVAAIPELVNMMLPSMYSSGLAYFDFLDGGLFGAGYHAMSGMLQFDEAVSVFPDEASLAVLPADALTFFTENGKLYLAVDKAFLARIGREKLNMDLCQLVDGFIALHPDLKIHSDEEVYALPLKYVIEGDKLTVMVDKEMMLPYLSLLSAVSELLLPEVIRIPLGESALGICVRPLLTGLLRALDEHTTSIELGIRLTRQAE